MEIIVELPSGNNKSVYGLDKDDKVRTLKNEIINRFDIDFQKHCLYFNFLTLNELMDDKKLIDVGIINYSIVKVREKSKNLNFFFTIFIYII